MNRRTDRQTDTRTDILTYRKHQPRGPMPWKLTAVAARKLTLPKGHFNRCIFFSLFRLVQETFLNATFIILSTMFVCMMSVPYYCNSCQGILVVKHGHMISSKASHCSTKEARILANIKVPEDKGHIYATSQGQGPRRLRICWCFSVSSRSQEVEFLWMLLSTWGVTSRWGVSYQRGLARLVKINC